LVLGGLLAECKDALANDTPTGERIAWSRDARGSVVRSLFVPLSLLGLGFAGREEQPLDRELGEILGESHFTVGETVVALYCDVKGRARFARAEVVFADGSRERIELFGTLRTGGLYELVTFDRPRAVAYVRIACRAERGTARLGLRLGV
jgi:hypothetical protein